MAEPYKHVYKLKYDYDPVPGEFSAEELEASGKGGSDALMLVSFLYPESGELSTNFFTCDGRNGGAEMEDIEIFKFWWMLASRLARSKDGSMCHDRKMFCFSVWQAFSEMLKGPDDDAEQEEDGE